MNENHGFFFYENTFPIDEQQDLVAHIHPTIGNTKALLDVYFEALRFPGYFGFNWNALSDCLRDLSWVKQYRVVVLHHGLPNLTKEDLSIYLDVLRECTRSWRPGEEHKLVVAFPNGVENTVLNNI